jgi:hypothetical protein
VLRPLCASVIPRQSTTLAFVHEQFDAVALDLMFRVSSSERVETPPFHPGTEKTEGEDRSALQLNSRAN